MKQGLMVSFLFAVLLNIDNNALMKQLSNAMKSESKVTTEDITNQKVRYNGFNLENLKIGKR